MFMFSMPRKGIVNVKMVITEEKILSNIEKINKLIDPKSKRQIIELEDDSSFKDLVESIKTYIIEYPKKKNFPKEIYDASYRLVEYATEQFEVNTKQIEKLIKKREYNIKTAAILKQTLAIVQSGDNEWKRAVDEVSERLPQDVVQALYIVGRKSKKDEDPEYQASMKLINAKVANLQSNLHIEIDLERVEDRSKALSYIGIEVADALKLIPTPVDTGKAKVQQIAAAPVQQAQVQQVRIQANVQQPVQQYVRPQVQPVQQNQASQPYQDYYQETRREVKESFWNKLANTKFMRAIKYAFKIRIRLQLQLPEGLPDGNNNIK